MNYIIVSDWAHHGHADICQAPGYTSVNSTLYCTFILSLSLSLSLPSLSWKNLVKSFLGTQIFGLLILTSMCLSLMHGYMTMAAEIMRFADRRFYEVGL